MTESALVCANHPDRPTTLRCNRCEKPICTKCAVLTPVGYRCKECVRGQQAVFETATPLDFVLAFVIAAIGTGLAAAFLSLISFWGVFVAPVVGGALAEAVRYAVRRRRGQRLPLTAAIGAVFGLVLLPIVPVFSAIVGLHGISLLPNTFWELILLLVNAGLIASTLYYRLRGIRM